MIASTLVRRDDFARCPCLSKDSHLSETDCYVEPQDPGDLAEFCTSTATDNSDLIFPKSSIPPIVSTIRRGGLEDQGPLASLAVPGGIDVSHIG